MEGAPVARAVAVEAAGTSEAAGSSAVSSVAVLPPDAMGAPLAAFESALQCVEGGASEHGRAVRQFPVPTAGGLEMGTVAGGSQSLFADELAAAVAGGQAAQQALTAWEEQHVQQTQTKWVELARHVARRCGCKVGKRQDGRFVVHETRDGEKHSLGTFGTARAAALAIVAKAREQDVDLKLELSAEEAVAQAATEGLKLVRSATSRSGYKGVYVLGDRFQADVRRGGRLVHLGDFGSAEAAALAYARGAREHGVEWMNSEGERLEVTAEDAGAHADWPDGVLVCEAQSVDV